MVDAFLYTVNSCRLHFTMSDNAYENQVKQILAFLTAELGREVVEADIHDEQHDPEKLCFKVRYDGALDTEQLVEVEYEKLKNHIVATRTAAAQEREEEMPPAQASRAMTLVRGEEFEENARKVIGVFAGVDLLADDGADQASAALAELNLGLKVVHGPPANVAAGVWLTQLSVVSEVPGDRRAGCSFQFGALAETAEAALALLQENVRNTRI